MKNLSLVVLPQTFSVYRFDPAQPIPEEVFAAPFFTITKTAEELSVVVPESVQLNSQQCEPGWSALMVQGPLDFELVGVLASIAGVLAGEGISLFAVSTYDTDYVLVKNAHLAQTTVVLHENGYSIVD